MGGASALVLALLSLHHFQCARLSAVGRSRGSKPVRLALRRRRHRCDCASARHCQSARRRVKHGGLRRAAFRLDVSADGAIAGCGERWGRIAGGGSSGVGRGMRGDRPNVSGTRIGGGGRSCGSQPHAHAAPAQRSARIRGILVPSAPAFPGRQSADAARVSGAAAIAAGFCERVCGASASGVVDRRR